MSIAFMVTVFIALSLGFIGFYAILVRFKEEAIQKSKIEGDRVNLQLRKLVEQQELLSPEERQRLINDWYQSKIF